jgi:hypothetical protein
MAMAIEAYEAPGAIAIAQHYPVADLKLLIDMTARLREDPEHRKARVDKELAVEFIDKYKDDTFVADDGEEFNLGEFLGI